MPFLQAQFHLGSLLRDSILQMQYSWTVSLTGAGTTGTKGTGRTALNLNSSVLATVGSGMLITLGGTGLVLRQPID
jgi:hypothetical protein